MAVAARTTIRIPEPNESRVRELAQSRGLSFAGCVNLLVSEALDRKKDEE